MSCGRQPIDDLGLYPAVGRVGFVRGGFLEMERLELGFAIGSNARSFPVLRGEVQAEGDG